MDITIILNQMVILFTLMFLGYFLYKKGIMNETFNAQLTKLLLNVTTPALILNSVLDENSSLPLGTVIEAFIVSIAIYLILPLTSRLITIIIRAPKQEAGIYDFLSTYANVGFMGFPIIAALLGSSGLLITAIVNIIFNLSVFSMGIFIICRGSRNKVVITPKNLLSPGITLSVLAIIIYLADIHFPATICSVISSVGSLTTPLAMMLIGSTLATMKLKEVFSDKRIYVHTLLRQIVLPLLCFPLLKLLIRDQLLLSVTFIMLIMPAGNTSVLFATNYNLDAKLAAKGVFVTTLFSIISIPVLLYLCMGA